MKQQTLFSIDKWIYSNLDLTEQILENHQKAIILIAGASSSGKSYSAQALKNTFENGGKRCVILSTDSYNKGVSGIIFSKTNQKLSNTLTHSEEIVSIIKDVIYDSDFENKFCPENLHKIKKQCSNLIPSHLMNIFLNLLADEFSKINFDEQSVYDLDSVAKDINRLCSNQTIKKRQYSKVVSEQVETNDQIDGKEIDVVIVEGIYALSKILTNNLCQNQIITNFVESDPKTLFLRRIIRDNKQTSASSVFTISNYFKYIMPSYLTQIVPTKQNANLIFENDMTNSELRSGEKAEIKEKIQIKNPMFVKKLLENSKIVSTIYHKDTYYCSIQEKINKDNLLRLRQISQNGKAFQPSSLIHKGEIKLRTDNKIIRPINLLIKEGDFFKIFDSFEDFDSSMHKCGFVQERTVEKKRTRIQFMDQDLVLDDIKDEGIFLEFSNNKNPEIIDFIKKQTQQKNVKNSDTKNLSKE